jgi:hypothetical protein
VLGVTKKELKAGCVRMLGEQMECSPSAHWRAADVPRLTSNRLCGKWRPVARSKVLRAIAGRPNLKGGRTVAKKKAAKKAAKKKKSSKKK